VTKGYNVSEWHVPSCHSRRCHPIVLSSTISHFRSITPIVVFDGDCTKVPNNFVGWPIVPGFDVAGIVTADGAAGGCGDFQEGDRVFGCTLFGAYSTRVAIPAVQLRKIPDSMSFVQAAALPAVSLPHCMPLVFGGALSDFPTETTQYSYLNPFGGWWSGKYGNSNVQTTWIVPNCWYCG
jgi:hypothetical protein